MLNEFRQFAMRGNLIDLAVGVIIGAAFGKIVESLVGDIIMPLLGALTGGLDFSNYFLPLSAGVTATTLAGAKAQGAVLAWGSFITVVVNFLIIALALFLALRLLMRAHAAAPAAPAAPARSEVLLEEIRNALVKAKPAKSARKA